jgi:hypothetical protein
MAVHYNPAYRVTPLFGVEEPAAASFCLMIVLVMLRHLHVLAVRGQRQEPGDLPLSTASSSFDRAITAHPYPIVKVLSLWAVTFSCAAWFHTSETVLNERLDYFTGFLTYSVMLYAGLPGHLQTQRARGLVAAANLVFIARMSIVSFDYGLAVKLMALLALGHYVVWLPWSVREWWSGARPHAKWSLAMHAVIAVFAPLELLDFVPIWGVFDGHGLWHGGGVLASYCWGRFLREDLEWSITHNQRKD